MILKNILKVTLLFFMLLLIGNAGLCSENSSGLELSNSAQETINHSCAKPKMANVMNHKKTGHHQKGCNSSKICCNDDLFDSKNALFSFQNKIEPESTANFITMAGIQLLAYQDINNPPQFNSPQARSLFLLHCTFLI